MQLVRISTERRGPTKRKREEKNISLQKMRREVQEIKTTDILTWNLQKMSMQVNKRRKLLRFAFYCLRKRHNKVLMSEITAKTPGVIWLGEGRNSATVIHSTKSAILHEGAWKQRWIDEGQKKCWGERVTSVTVAHLRLVAVYQPLWQYGEETMEIYRKELEEQVTTSTHQQWLIIGGDYNSHMGYGGHRLFADGTEGPFGMGIRDCTGDDFLQGFEDNNLSWADSFVSMEHRGTWFNRLNAKWYELDGFVLKKHQRSRLLKDIKVIKEDSFSHHRPKQIIINVRKPLFKGKSEKPGKKVDTDKLRLDPFVKKFKETVQNKEQELKTMGWTEPAKTIHRAALEIFGRTEKNVNQPWMKGREQECENFRKNIA